MKARTLLHAAGYAATPRKTLARHPWKALTGWLAFHVVKRKMATPPVRKAMAAAGALAASAVVAPLAVKAIRDQKKA